MADHQINVDVNFGNANQNFQTLIDSMNRLQGIVTQLGTTIQTTNSNTATSNAKSQKSVTDYAGAYSTLTKDIKDNRAALVEELKALEQLRKANNQDADAINNRITQAKKLETLIKQQTTTLNQYNKALGQTSAQATKVNSALSSVTKGFNSLGAVLGVSFGAYGAFRVLTEATKAIAEFDLAQKKLQSILAETNAGMKVISDSAIEVGKSSIFGAKGVTELQIELAKMGFAKDEIIAMQGAIVNLATATQEELAPSAEVVSNILRAFQLTAADAAMVVDVMGKAFNDSALDLSNFRESIKYVAPIAKQANFSFAETVSLLEQLSNAGIKGSLAGTGLTNIISRLGNENSKFVKTLGRTVNGFDDFLAALVELKNRGADLTDIFQLVDRRAAATFSILLDGVDTVEQFRAKLEQSAGTMETQAAVQLESLTYKARLLKESWKAMIIEMDESSNVITGLASAFLDLGNSIITALGDPAKQAAKVVSNIQQETSNINNLIVAGFVSLNEAEKQIYNERLLNARDYYAQISDIESQYQQKVAAAQQLPIGSRGIAIAAIKNDFADALAAIKVEFKGVNEEISSLSIETTNKALKPYVDEFVRLKNETGDLNQAFLIQVGRLTKLRDTFPKASLNAQVYQKAIEAINAEYEKLNKTGLDTDTTVGTDVNDKLKNRLQFQIDILESQKKATSEQIKLEEEGYNEKIELARNDYAFTVKILDLKKQLYIANGQSISDASEKTTADLKENELNYLNEVDKAWKESFNMKEGTFYDLVDISEKSLAESKKQFLKYLDEVVKANRDLTEALSEQFLANEKFKNDNPIASLLGITVVSVSSPVLFSFSYSALIASIAF